MEVLRRVRAGRRTGVTRLPGARPVTLLVLCLAACRGGERSGLPGDTAIAFTDDSMRPSDGAGSDTASVADSSGDPDSAGVATGTTVVLAADSAAGQQLFNRAGRCFTCHGARAEGMTSLGPSLTDTIWLHGDGSLRAIERVIANGVATPRETPIAMPAFGGQLTAAEITRLTAFIYSISHPASVVADTARVDTLSAPGVLSDADSARASVRRDSIAPWLPRRGPPPR